MATLLQKLQQNLGQATAATEPAGGETATVQQMLAAKRGIVGPSSALGPQGLSVGDIAARAPAQQQLAQLGQAAQLQGTAIEQAAAAQAEEQRQREQAIESQRAETSLRGRIQTESILQNLEQGRAELGEKQRQLGLEQVAANLRLQDRQYVDNLRREGERARLKEDLSFDEALKKSIFADNMELLKLKIGNRSILDASERDFNKTLAEMDINEAIRIQRANMEADKQRALIGGVAGLVPVATQAFGAQQSGSFSGGYQDYVNSVPEGQRPLSFTAWQTQSQQAGSSAAKGNLPSTGYTGGVLS